MRFKCCFLAGWSWIRSQKCSGTSNLLAALKLALYDYHTKAIYVVASSKANQSAMQILAELQRHHVIPVNTISFNCLDDDANELLFEVAKKTGGRFHSYNDANVALDVSLTLENDDVKLLEAEYRNGVELLEKMTQLHQECLKHARNNKDDGFNEKMPMFRKNFFQLHKALQQDMSSVQSSSQTDEYIKGSQDEGLFQNDLSKKPKGIHFFDEGSNEPEKLKTYDDWILPESKEFLNRHAEPANNVASRKSSDRQRRHLSLCSYDKSCSISDATFLTRDETASLKPTMAQWIKQNGIKANNLTMLDALRSAAVRVRARYDNTLKKEILPKVYSDSFPLTFEGSPRKLKSGKNERTVTMVGPSSIQWSTYRQDLAHLSKTLERKWRSLLEIAANSNEAFGAALMNACKVTCLKNLLFVKHNTKINIVLEQMDFSVLEEQDYYLIVAELEKVKHCYEKSYQLEKSVLTYDELLQKLEMDKLNVLPIGIIARS